MTRFKNAVPAPLKTIACLLIGAFAALAVGPVSAEAGEKRTRQSFAFDASGAVSGKPQVARKGRPLLVAQVRGLDVVAIDEPVEVAVTNDVKVTSRRVIAPGEVLQGWPATPGVYCTAARDSPLWVTAACLRDADGDGRFESSLTASFHLRKVETYNISNKANFIAVWHGADAPLAKPLPYRKADPASGPPARVKLKWVIAGTPAPGEPITVSLFLEAANVTSSSYGISEPQTYTLSPDGVGDMTFHGLVVKAQGLNPDGSLRYTTSGGAGGDAVDIIFQYIEPPTVINIPVYIPS